MKFQVQTGYRRISSGYRRIQKDLDKKKQDILGYTQDIKALNNEIDRLKEDIKKAPDLVEFVQLQAKYEGLQEIIREKDRSIKRLENDLKKADIDKEDLKTTYNNYFLQVQLLINQKAMGTGSTKKEGTASPEDGTASPRKERRKPASKKEHDVEPENKPEAPKAGHDGLIEKICKNCNEAFFTGNIRQETCTGNCRSEFSKKKKKGLV